METSSAVRGRRAGAVGWKQPSCRRSAPALSTVAWMALGPAAKDRSIGILRNGHIGILRLSRLVATLRRIARILRPSQHPADQARHLHLAAPRVQFSIWHTASCRPIDTTAAPRRPQETAGAGSRQGSGKSAGSPGATAAKDDKRQQTTRSGLAARSDAPLRGRSARTAFRSTRSTRRARASRSVVAGAPHRYDAAGVGAQLPEFAASFV
jgi:hypothetical protein